MADPLPLSDYCFLWIDHWSTCMTKSEWSGWVQALGSIGALLGIWYTIQKQRQLTLEAEERQAQAALNAAMMDASSAVAVVSAVAHMTAQAAAAENLVSLRLNLLQLADGMQLAQAVRLDCLPLEVRGAVITIRSAAASLTGGVELVLNNAANDRARLAALQALAFISNDLAPKLEEQARIVARSR